MKAGREEHSGEKWKAAWGENYSENLKEIRDENPNEGHSAAKEDAETI